MASLTEILAAQKNPTVDVAGNVSAGVKAGIGLATAADQIEASKQQVEAQKAELIVKQAQTANSLLTNLARANPMIAKKMLPQVKEKLLNLGVDPTVAEYTVSDDANRKRQIAFSNLASGKIPSDPKFAAEYFQSLADVVGYDQAAQQFDNAQKRAQEDKKMSQQNQQFYAGLEAQKEVAGIKSGAKAPAGVKLTKADEKRDTEFAKEYSSFFDQGGASRIESNLNLLEPVMADLEKGKTSKYTGLFGDTVQNIIDPTTANVKTNVNSVLIQSLKDTFGGQLSDGERKAMVDSVYKDTADPKANAKRLREFVDKIKAGAAAKQAAGQYFEENGTLKGFKGTQNFDIAGKTLKIDQVEPSKDKTPQDTAVIDADIEAKLKTLPPGADINLARQALLKAKANLSAGK